MFPILMNEQAACILDKKQMDLSLPLSPSPPGIPANLQISNVHRFPCRHDANKNILKFLVYGW